MSNKNTPLSDFDFFGETMEQINEARLDRLIGKRARLEQIVNNLSPQDPQGVRVELAQVEGDIKMIMDRRAGE